MTTRDQTIERDAQALYRDNPFKNEDAIIPWRSLSESAKRRFRSVVAANVAPSAEPAQDRSAQMSKWYVGAQNDLLYLINEPPRPAPVDYINTSLQTKVIAGPFDPSHAETVNAMVAAHNAALVPVQQGVEGERVLSGPMQFDKPEPTDADAETLKEMQAQLWAAGLDLEESAFVAKMLFRNGQRVTRASPPHPVNETLALKTIAEFPITDPKNQDAVNMAAIARTSLNVPTPVRETVSEAMVEAALAAYLEQAAKQMIGTSSPSGNRPTHVYNLVDAHEDDEPIFTGSDEQCRNFCMKRSLTAALSAALAQPVAADKDQQ